MKRTVNFVVNGDRASIKFEIDPALNPGRPHMALSGNIDGHGGQCDGALLKKGAEFPEIVILCDLWAAHHLKKSTKKAEKAINTALDALDGKRFGHAVEVYDAPDVSENDDTIDSRDVIKRIEIYADALTDAGVNIDALDSFDPEDHPSGDELARLVEEYKALKDLEDQADSGDWKYGTTLVNESYFTDFAKEEAESLGLIKNDTEWPARHIDWEAAADDLKSDYSTVTFGDTTFYLRN